MVASRFPALTRRALLQAGFSAAALAVLEGSLPSALAGEGGVRRNWRNWSGSQMTLPKQWLTPQSEQSLIEVLRAASGTVRVTGASHSFSALCATDDTLLSLDDMQGLISHDAEKLQARVWAGTRLRELGQPLWDIGQSLINQGDVDPQSVAGACGTSTHGTGITLGSFSSVMRGVRLVTPSGEIIECDAQREADVFHAASTSLGALGVLTQITLQNRAAYKLHEQSYTESLDEVLRKLDQYVADNRHFEFWAFFESDLALVKLLNETEAESTTKGLISLPVDTVLWLACELAHAVPAWDGGMQRLLTALVSSEEKIGRAFEVFPSPRDVRFNEMEYELPVADGPDCLREILEAVRKKNLNTLFPVEYRTAAADDCWLSPFYQRDSASISIHQYHQVDYKPLFDFVEPIFWKYQARPHWGKLHTLGAKALAPLYPKWDEFQAVRRRLDPSGRMLNAHLHKLFGET
ncbi:MAG: D-arabinono-1,4-lactone oxidase [Nevskiales bacterium]